MRCAQLLATRSPTPSRENVWVEKKYRTRVQGACGLAFFCGSEKWGSYLLGPSIYLLCLKRELPAPLMILSPDSQDCHWAYQGDLGWLCLFSVMSLEDVLQAQSSEQPDERMHVQPISLYITNEWTFASCHMSLYAQVDCLTCKTGNYKTHSRWRSALLCSMCSVSQAYNRTPEIICQHYWCALSLMMSI